MKILYSFSDNFLLITTNSSIELCILLYVCRIILFICICMFLDFFVFIFIFIFISLFIKFYQSCLIRSIWISMGIILFRLVLTLYVNFLFRICGLIIILLLWIGLQGFMVVSLVSCILMNSCYSLWSSSLMRTFLLFALPTERISSYSYISPTPFDNWSHHKYNFNPHNQQ